MRTKTIQILYPAQIVGATMLKPGIYQVGLDRASQSPTLDFYQNRKEVAQAPVKLVSSPTKNSETEVQYALPGTGT
ncbi:MAG TPA: hypothetical protein VG206_26375 [Terriglobia bacterium]|nr:hypothetical protein [Terriglobia bacterium]